MTRLAAYGFLALTFVGALIVPMPIAEAPVGGALRTQVEERYPGWDVAMTPVWENGFSVVMRCGDSEVGYLLHRRRNGWLVLIPSNFESRDVVAATTEFYEPNLYGWHDLIPPEEAPCQVTGAVETPGASRV